MDMRGRPSVQMYAVSLLVMNFVELKFVDELPVPT